MLIAASQASIYASRGDTARLQMAKIRGKLQAVYWRAAARGPSASETAIQTVKRCFFKTIE